ncbi:glycoside hydrolase family 99-like domain-containing protein [Mucilaginibacter sp. X5P1]|uniref:glycosyltransferase WbsX family protein n=1 Tax=Mucilaginibacter sp. X5P1 TaxID=2723088 RepID=UPI00161791B1|nr:glycoside hydrolase family 99-like domain-containing protein [Mucilaginibacter sp. X5P1]MBB6141211.1 hypothetical protein [Mucilaginibacter sp. X5P1]
MVKTSTSSTPKPRIIAYYLPQYHPIQENDEWWGKGFTEWVSVANAKPLFKGHEQPKIPGELGFYDLRLEESRIAQAEIAAKYGVEGFCYWHYWLGNGKRLLERPFNEVLESGKPDFPFCLGWANHSWKGVFFGAKNQTLIEQTYGDLKDHQEHFDYLLKAFKDKRYIKLGNKPLLYIYKAQDIPDCKKVLDFWRNLAIKEGFDGIHFIGENVKPADREKYGLDGLAFPRHREIEYGDTDLITNKYLRFIYHKIKKIAPGLKVYNYKDAIKTFLKPGEYQHNEYPCIVPGWDTTPRLGKKAVILKDSTPELFKQHVKEVLNRVSHKPDDSNFIFIKSWNEWAEGNYMEPDWKNGSKYLEVLKEALDEQ